MKNSQSIFFHHELHLVLFWNMKTSIKSISLPIQMILHAIFRIEVWFYTWHQFMKGMHILYFMQVLFELQFIFCFLFLLNCINLFLLFVGNCIFIFLMELKCNFNGFISLNFCWTQTVWGVYFSSFSTSVKKLLQNKCHFPKSSASGRPCFIWSM